MVVHTEWTPDEGVIWENANWPTRSLSDWTLPATDLEAQVESPTDRAVHWTEKVRHTVLLLRLQRPYFVYCLVCSLLAAVAFISTLVDLFGSHSAGRLSHSRAWHDVLEGGTWQSLCWTLVGLALAAEVASSVVMRRGCRCASDGWHAFDAVVLLLTVILWAVSHLRRASPMREEIEEADLWLLAVRFSLQPCRVLAAASMARKVQQMQQNYMDVSFDKLAVASQPQEHGASPKRPGEAVAMMEACAIKGPRAL